MDERCMVRFVTAEADDLGRPPTEARGLRGPDNFLMRRRCSRRCA